MQKQLLSFLIFIFYASSAYAQLLPVYQGAHRIGNGNFNYSDRLRTFSNEDLLVVGRFDGIMDFDPSAASSTRIAVGGSDIFFARYTPSGTLVWVKSFGSQFTDRVYSAEIDAADNIYFAGTVGALTDFDPDTGVVNLTHFGGTDAFVAKYSGNGEYLWAKTIGNTATEYAEGLSIDNLGNLYVCGYYSGTSLDLDGGVGVDSVFNSGTSGFDFYLAKYDTAGNYIWGGSGGGNGGSDYARTVASDANGMVYLGGSFLSSADFDLGPGLLSMSATGSSDAYLVQYDSNGVLQWSFPLGGSGSDAVFDLKLDLSGNITPAGTFNQVVDFNPDPLVVNSVVATGGTDIYFAKYDASGNYINAKGFGGNSIDIIYEIQYDNTDNLYVTGYFNQFIDVNPGPDTTNLVSWGGGNDGFVAKYDPSFNLLWGLRLGGFDTDYCRSMQVNAANELWVSGYFQTAIYINPNNLSQTIPSVTTSGYDVYWSRYGECSYPQISTPPSNSGICPGSNTSFSIAASGIGLSYQWQESTDGGITWNNMVDGPNVSGATSPTVNLIAVPLNWDFRFYRCRAIASCSLESMSGVGVLQVNLPNTSVQQNGQVLSSVQNGPGSTWQWLDCNNGYQAIPGATNQSFIPGINGSFAVAAGRYGCVDTSACYTITGVGLEEVEASEGLFVYPNPATSLINLEWETSFDATTLLLITARGQQIRTIDLSGRNRISVDVKDLSSGLYVVRLINAESKAVSKRILILQEP